MTLQRTTTAWTSRAATVRLTATLTLAPMNTTQAADQPFTVSPIKGTAAIPPSLFLCIPNPPTIPTRLVTITFQSPSTNKATAPRTKFAMDEPGHFRRSSHRAKCPPRLVRRLPAVLLAGSSAGFTRRSLWRACPPSFWRVTSHRFFSSPPSFPPPVLSLDIKSHAQEYELLEEYISIYEYTYRLSTPFLPR